MRSYFTTVIGVAFILWIFYVLVASYGWDGENPWWGLFAIVGTGVIFLWAVTRSGK